VKNVLATHRELAPYATASNMDIDGPDIVLSAEAGQILAKALNRCRDIRCAEESARQR